ncbi:MAG TPA: hypothetical protein VEY07_04555 [Thermoplasmata archaeon]|nr:hypothetical protein [Thermoplasmata archaeon]
MDSATPFPAEWYERPINLLVAGADRPRVNLLALAVAQSVADRFIWLDVRDPFDPPSPLERRALALIPPELRFIARRPEMLKPNDAAANLALWTVGSGDPTHSAPPLADELRIPAFLRDILGRVVRTGAPVPLVLANADRLAEYYPEGESATRGWLKLLQQEEVSLIVSWSGSARSDVVAFESVLRLELPPGSSLDASQVIVDRFAPESALWRPGSVHGIGEIPHLSELWGLRG